jgi:molybdopterin-containing oxidoreductase family membrane subunit
MVLTIMIPATLIYPQLKDLLTREHVDKMAKIILLTGSIVGYAYTMELFVAYYGANRFERFTFFHHRFNYDGTGWYQHYAWAMYFCNVISPQIFWFKRARQNWIIVFIVCQFVSAGMWFERFVIICTSLVQDFLPSSWGHYFPSWVEIWTFIGTFGIFLTLFLLFMRFLPMVAMSEVKIVTPQADPHAYVPDSGVGIAGHHPVEAPSKTYQPS